MAKILVVDDEPNIREVVGLYLRREGYDVLSAADGEEGLELYHQGRPDLVVLDLILPKLDGLEVCRRMQAQRRVPLIMLTARGEEADRVLGMGAGADDYVVKPFRLRELMARVSALLRETEARTNQADGGTLAFDGMRLDPVTREVVIRGTTATLTAREFDLLYHLASSPGRTFTRDELMEAVWDHQFAAEPTAVTMSVRRLREKIEEDPGHPRHLLTIWGVDTGWGSGGAYVGPALVLVALVLVLGACGPAGGGDQAETVTVIKTVPADEGSGRAE
jgi:DNA-binding response OmpR family regulator